jgi:hypothetical protein
LKGEFFLGWGAEQVPGWEGRSRSIAKNSESFARNFTAKPKALPTPSS